MRATALRLLSTLDYRRIGPRLAVSFLTLASAQETHGEVFAVVAATSMTCRAHQVPEELTVSESLVTAPVAAGDHASRQDRRREARARPPPVPYPAPHEILSVRMPPRASRDLGQADPVEREAGVAESEVDTDRLDLG